MPIEYLIIVFQVVVFLFAISLHESAHAWMASRFGDQTARMLGRVTLNPIKHIDPIGTILMPVLCLLAHFPMFGWAKPTPVNTRNFGVKNIVRGDIMTSVAGPVSNFSLAFVATLLLVLIGAVSSTGRLIVTELAMTYGNQVSGNSVLAPLCLLLYQAMLINVLLAVFNLIPVPPLDGSHVLRHFLAEPVRRIYDNVGMVALLLLVWFGGGILGALISPFLNFFNAILIRA
jgi:Zn-dependent protease